MTTTGYYATNVLQLGADGAGTYVKHVPISWHATRAEALSEAKRYAADHPGTGHGVLGAEHVGGGR